MKATTDPVDSPPKSSRARFSLRTLLVAVMLVAAFSAGWVSHRSWNRRNVDQAISDAIEQIGGPVQVERAKPTDVLIIKGSQQDVQKMEAAIGDVQAAANR